MNATRTPAQVLDRLITATNAHDIDGLVDCFAQDYTLTDPVHPARSFTGSAQVRRNWTTMFDAVPDIRLNVQERAVTDKGFWLEAAQEGTGRDDRRLEMRTVFIAVVAGGQITSARMYAAPVEQGGPGIDAVFAAIAGKLRSASDAVDGTGGNQESRP
ncbi:nuclear transport factor 2 family protein [Terrabacter terrae]